MITPVKSFDKAMKLAEKVRRESFEVAATPAGWNPGLLSFDLDKRIARALDSYGAERRRAGRAEAFREASDLCSRIRSREWGALECSQQILSYAKQEREGER